MKKKITLVLTLTSVAISLLTGCSGSSDNIPKNAERVTEVVTTTVEAVTTQVATTTTEIPITQEQPQKQAAETTQKETPAPHTHTYIEAITAEATCEAEGIKTYSCECGDSYTESIAATGHSFESYIFNNDATYLADGTETAKCNNCEATDTRTAEGSMLIYTYTDMDATMYAQKTVNVRSLPSTDGEKLGSLSTNDEVKVTGQCVETSWYRIEYEGNVAYVSNSYLGVDKVVVQVEAPTQNTSSEFPYQLWTMYDNGSVAWFYMPGLDHGYPPEYGTAYIATSEFNHAHFTFDMETHSVPGFDEACLAAGSTGDTHITKCKTEWYVNGKRVWRYFAW